MVTFLIFCLFRERPGVNFDIVAIMNSNTPILVPQYSRYFKNPWGLKLFLKCHRRSQNVYFFYLGPIISLNIQVYSSEHLKFLTTPFFTDQLPWLLPILTGDLIL